MLRFALPLFPEPAHDLRRWFVAIAIIGLLWCSLMAFRQPDSRGVIAYSSIAQMSLIGLGIFVMNDIGATGATFQMVNHGLLSVLLFLLAGIVEVRTGDGPLPPHRRARARPRRARDDRHDDAASRRSRCPARRSSPPSSSCCWARSATGG